MSADFDWSSFIEVPGFLSRWDAIGCTDADLRALQLSLLSEPASWPVVKGAGGWRKARFAPPSRSHGKSGAIRVYYADLTEFGIIVLGTAFTKSEMDELSANGKKYLANMLSGIIQRRKEMRDAEG